MKNIFSKNTYRTLNLIEIKKQALLDNYAYFQKIHPEAKIAPVLKSNAYGHGLRLVGKFADTQIKPEFICVDSLFEAYELQKARVKSKILILGYTFPENFKYKKIDFCLPLFDLATLDCLKKYQPGIKVHLKIDTGMNRLGIKDYQYEQFAEALKNQNKVILEGIYSHLCDAPDKDFSKTQIEKFKKAINFFENQGFEFKYKHLFATTGALKYHDPEFNLIRLGLGFYGIAPDEAISQKNLTPALSLKSHLIEIKKINKGEEVGYDRTFKAKDKMILGLLPLGYYDGIDRKLSNKGYLMANNAPCPIIGNVCMNITAIDLAQAKNPQIGTEIIVYSNCASDPNSLTNCAKIAKTIPYVLLANLSETTRRVLI